MGCLPLFKFFICYILSFLITFRNWRQVRANVRSSWFSFKNLLTSKLGSLFAYFFYWFLPFLVFGPENVIYNISIFHSFLKLNFLVQLFNLFLLLSFGLLFLNFLNPHIFPIFRNVMRNFNRLRSFSSELFFFRFELFILLLVIFNIIDVKNILFLKKLLLLLVL